MKNRNDLTALAKIQGGLPILGCLPGSPAAQAGVRYGDILMSVNGQPVSTLQEFLHARKLDPNQQRIEVFRDGELITYTLQLRDMEGVPADAVAHQILAEGFLGRVDELPKEQMN